MSSSVTSGVPQGCSLSGVLYIIAMIWLLVKLSCLPLKGKIRPNQVMPEEYLCKKIFTP